MKLFYTVDFDKNNPILSPEESKHCLRVLRIQDGHSIHITNGKGDLFAGKIRKVGKLAHVDIDSHTNSKKPRPYKLHMAICPTKNMDRFEWFLEKATEIGLDEITPIVSFHSERKKIKEERLEKILISAMKQSLQTHKPILNPVTTFAEFIEEEDETETRYIAHCQNDETKEHIKEIDQSAKNIVLLIGPEGDFSDDEIDLAKSKNFKAIGLGKSRLRTETAGIVACHSINFLFDE